MPENERFEENSQEAAPLAGAAPPAEAAPPAVPPQAAKRTPRENLLERQAKREAERRGSERGVLVLVVVGLVVLVGFAALKTIPWSREAPAEPPPPPPALPRLFRGYARLLDEKRVEVHYDFNRLWNDYNSPHMDWETGKGWRWEFVYLWKEPAGALAAEMGRRLALTAAPPGTGVSCARLAGGALETAAAARFRRGMVRGSRGFVVGPMRYRCVFDGDVAFEFTAKLLAGAGINPQICGATMVGDDPGERRFYELALEPGPDGEPGRARIRYYDYDDEGKLRRKDLAGPVEIPFERGKMVRVRFELAGDRLVGYLAPAAKRDEILKHRIIDAAALDHRVGDVALQCWGAEASFDNVRIVGAPHPDWIAKAAEFYRLLGSPRGDRAVRMPEQPKAAAPIAPSVEGENADPSAPAGN